MVTSRISYSLHCDIGRTRDCVTPELAVYDDVPTLYVAVATWIPKCNMYNVDADVAEKTDRIEETNEIVTTENESKIQEDSSLQEKTVTKCIEEIGDQIEVEKKDTEIKSPVKESPENSSSIKNDMESPIDKNDESAKNSDVESPTNKNDESLMTNNETLEEEQISSNNDDSLLKDDGHSDSDKEDTSIVVTDSNITPKKNIQDVKKEKGSSKKKNPEDRQKSKEERDRKRNEEKEAKEKIKREKIEQKIKERLEKEEQRKKEKFEKEEQKRKEKEEKEEQKKKEKEEKEAQRIKEKEEKETQRIKEKEEKEAQKQKEREEKEEQKKKEKEEKELKRLQDLEKDKKKMEKESAAFVNFFVPRKSTNSLETKKTEEIISYFMPFQIKADMRLAPSIRHQLTKENKEKLLQHITNQDQTNLYLSEIKNKTLGKTTKTWPIDDNDDIIVLDDTAIGECLDEQPIKNIKMRAKFLQFHENRRPAYFGTWRKTSKNVNPRKPLGMDKKIFDYEVDSDDDWEEEEPGESLHGSDDEEKEEKENETDEYEVDNDFFVPHGYLSDEEAENEENMETPETQKEKLKILQIEFEEEMKSKTERIKPRLIGCIWESKLKPKIQDAITSFLEERMMIISAPIIIKKRELNKENNNTSNKNSTPTRKLLNKELIPDFLKMIHGNTNNRIYLVNEFLNFLTNQNIDVNVSKAGLTSQLKELATWKKCPDEGVMFNKTCWYVHEEVRKQYNLNLILPNKWIYSDESTAKKKLNL